jgi:hypothetical protein
VSFVLFSDTQKAANTIFTNLERASRKDPALADFLGALAGVLKEVFKAVKEYKPLISDAFGPLYVERFVVEVIKDLDNKVLVHLATQFTTFCVKVQDLLHLQGSKSCYSERKGSFRSCFKHH